MPSKLAIAGATVALAALVTTAPTAVQAAGNITGKQIKNNSISGKDVKANSLKGSDVKDGTLSGADLADGSVSGADLADGSVSGADVTDGSLHVGDFAPGELPYTRAFQFANPGTVNLSGATTVGSVSLPQAGTYLVTAKLNANFNGAGQGFLDCTLSDGVISDELQSGFDDDAGDDDYRAVGALLATTVGAPTTVTWTCDGSGKPFDVYSRRIVAVKVASLG